MKGRLAWGLFAALLALALALGLATHQHAASDDPTPSIGNAGPRGLKVLATWLAESGTEVRIARETLTPLPAGTATVVVPAPAGRTISQEELDTLLAFARGGGTLVLLLPRAGGQPLVQRALGAREGPTPPPSPSAVDLEDPSGVRLAALVPAGLLAGVKALRVSAQSTLVVDDDGSAPVVEGGALWWRALGAGEVYFGAGADLAENARLDLLDNAVFWAQVGRRGPVLFDEAHHLGAPAPRLAPSLLAAALQLCACALMFLAAHGQRLGPPRSGDGRRHRSSMEYIQAMATLTQNANVDPEVIDGLHAEARQVMRDRLGIDETLPEDERLRAVSDATGLPWEKLRPLFASSSVLAATEALARLEFALNHLGDRPPPHSEASAAVPGTRRR